MFDCRFTIVVMFYLSIEWSIFIRFAQVMTILIQTTVLYLTMYALVMLVHYFNNCITCIYILEDIENKNPD